MPNSKNAAPIPTLRFPEFRDRVTWRETTLGDAVDFKAGTFVQASEISDTSAGDSFPCYGGNGIRGYTRSYTHDGTYSLVGRQGALCGNVRLARGQFHATEHALVAYPKSSVSTEWLFYALVSLELNRYATGQAQPGLSVDVLERVKLAIPTEPGEQTKIADCLVSLDAAISTQGQQVEALKNYKRGLIQRLFPRGSESYPRLRFPPFRDVGQWSITSLGSHAWKVGSGITPLGGDKTYTTQGRPFVRSQNVGWGKLLLHNIAYIDEETHRAFIGTEIQVNDVLLNITGASIGRSAIADSRIAGGNVNQHVCIIRTKQSELSPAYLNQYLISERGQTLIDALQAGGNRQGLNFEQIRSFELPLPPTLHEQERIAAILTALDAAAFAEESKLKNLEVHKRGIIEGLFPFAASAK